MFAKAVHLQGFITYSKSTFPTAKSHTQKATSPTLTDIQMWSRGDPVMGKFYRLSEDSESSKTIEVLGMKTVKVESEPPS
jgi:hypothetical protein